MQTGLPDKDAEPVLFNIQVNMRLRPQNAGLADIVADAADNKASI